MIQKMSLLLFHLKTTSRSERGTIQRFSCGLIGLHKEAEKIRAKFAKSRLSSNNLGYLYNQKKRCKFFKQQAARRYLEQTFSHNINSDFVEFEENIKELVTHLTVENKKPIWEQEKVRVSYSNQ